MKFYITIEGVPKLKRSFLNLKLFSIINIPDILADHGYSFENIDEYGSFIVTKKLFNLIKNYSKSKRIRGIIYCNPNLNFEIIENLIDFTKEFEKIEEIVLLDDYNVPKLQYMYNHFTEIIFFPSIKKIRLIEAKPIPEFVSFRS